MTDQSVRIYISHTGKELNEDSAVAVKRLWANSLHADSLFAAFFPCFSLLSGYCCRWKLAWQTIITAINTTFSCSTLKQYCHSISAWISALSARRRAHIWLACTLQPLHQLHSALPPPPTHPPRAWHHTRTQQTLGSLMSSDSLCSPSHQSPPLPTITLLLYPSPLPPTVPPSGPMRCFRGHSWLRIFHGQRICTQTFFSPAEAEHTHAPPQCICHCMHTQTH